MYAENHGIHLYLGIYTEYHGLCF